MPLSHARFEVLEQQNATLLATVAELSAKLTAATEELAWYRRQVFGSKSEKRLEFDDARQASLFASLGIEAGPAEDVPTQKITYRRRVKCRDGAVNEAGLRFDESVPVETIVVTDPAIEAIPESQREVIGEKVTHRLAQEPGSYKVLKYGRQVVRRRDTGRMLTPPAPAGVLGRAAVDVSFLAGLLVEKFRWHLPLYRQHARLADAGITVSRRSLTNWAGRAIDLLSPVVKAQSRHILSGDVIAMDETSIRAGRTGPGKMRAARDGPVGVPRGPRGGHRHQSCQTRPQGNSDGTSQLAVRLDGGGRRTRGRDPEPAGDLSASRREPLHLFTWCLPPFC